ncbi:MAG: beta-eliminating lyase-related protein [Ferruginibacter sp.]
MIDLRSDTVTKPTDPMRAAMAAADVGDDVYGEDPTVRELEERVAGLLGKEAALFTPTGSMANVLAVRSLVGVGEEVLCESRAHIARAELGAHGAVTGLTMRTWVGAPRDLATVASMFAPDMGPFLSHQGDLGGEHAQLRRWIGHRLRRSGRPTILRRRARGRRTPRRGALVERPRGDGAPLADYGATADVVAVCLSKGLGAPIGSLVVGTAAAIEETRVWRKRLGGGMRQVGVLAAAGLFVLDHHIERLADDHANAALIARALGAPAPDTNIVVLEVPDAPTIVAAAPADQGVIVSAVGPRALRIVTHLDVTPTQARTAADTLARLLP